MRRNKRRRTSSDPSAAPSFAGGARARRGHACRGHSQGPRPGAAAQDRCGAARQAPSAACLPSEQNLYNIVRSGGSPQPVKTFLCPTRRSTSAGPKDDYCTGLKDVETGSPPTILGGGTPVSLSVVTATNGSSNTLLLAHKVMRPANYSVTSVRNADTTWEDPNPGNRDHTRPLDPGGSGCSAGHGYTKDANCVDEHHQGGPHPSGAPVLWTDGHVSLYPYLYSSNGLNDLFTFSAFWTYMNQTPVTPP